MVSLLLALLAVSGTAGETVSSAPKAEAKAEKKICRRIEGETGSRTGGQRICLTKAQWDAVDRQERGAAKDSEKPSTTPGSN